MTTDTTTRHRRALYRAQHRGTKELDWLLERYAEARLGGNRGEEATANLAVACFEHDTARPVESAPDARRDVQLHTHCVAFNMTEAADKIRSLQPRALFRSQKLATAVYRATLARKLQEAGYEIEIDAETGAPEIAGYTKEYLRAASQRSAQIDTNLAKLGLERRAGTTKRAVRVGRVAKGEPDPAYVRAAQLRLAREYGDQHRAVVARMLARGPRRPDAARERSVATGALHYALDDCTSRSATTSVRDVLTVALRAGLGNTSAEAVIDALDRANTSGEVVPIGERKGGAARVTTKEMIELERGCVELCLAGRNRHDAFVPGWGNAWAAKRLTELSEAQRRAFVEITSQRDTVYALQGLAGVGKTRLLATVTREALVSGYDVIGLAPSGVAAAQLTAGGINAQTMQMFLTRRDQSRRPRLFIVDETSLASTRMVRVFLGRLRPDDRVLLVGDVAQHESVEAGRIFAQLQAAGLGCSVLDEIRRQEDLKLLKAVERLASQDVPAALAELRTDQIREVRSQEARFRAIADEFAKQPEGTLVVAPTHRERREITAHIRERLRADGVLGTDVQVTALDPRNDYSEPALKKAYTYREGDVVRYRVGSQGLNLAAGSYAKVTAVDATKNRLAVTTSEGRTVLYDPSRLSGVEIYRERERSFAVGDRVIVTLGNREKRIPKSTTGAIVGLEGTAAKVRLEDGRTTTLDLATWHHVDHAFVLTSYASQSLTTSRVIVHVDTDHAEAMVNERFGYVAASRAVNEAVIFTDRKDRLAEKLGREYSNTSAIEELARTAEALGALSKHVQAAARKMQAIVNPAPSGRRRGREQSKQRRPRITLDLKLE